MPAGAGPRRGLGCGGSFETINVQGACIHDPGAIEVAGLEQEAFIAAAKYGSFSAVIHEDERLRAGRIRDGYEARVDPGVSKFAPMQIAGFVVAELANVACVQTPGLTGDDGGGSLAAGQDGGVGVFGLGSAGREVHERDQRVDRIETHAYEVDLTLLRHSSYSSGGNLRASHEKRYENFVFLQSIHAPATALASNMTTRTPTQPKFIASAGTRALTPSQMKTPTAQARIA